jgi:hypothetical protein
MDPLNNRLGRTCLLTTDHPSLLEETNLKILCCSSVDPIGPREKPARQSTTTTTAIAGSNHNKNNDEADRS